MGTSGGIGRFRVFPLLGTGKARFSFPQVFDIMVDEITAKFGSETGSENQSIEEVVILIIFGDISLAEYLISTFKARKR